MMTLILIGIFLTELIKYGIWFRGIQGLRFKRLGLGCALAGSYVVLILVGVVDVETLLLVYSIVAVAVCGMMLEGRKGRLIYVLQAFFITLCISEAITIFFKLNLNRLWYDRLELKTSYFFNNTIVIIIFCIALLLRGKVSIVKRNCELIWQWIMQLSIMAIGITVFFVISGFQNIAEFVTEDMIRKISMLMSVVSFVFLACLIIMISYMYAQNKKYQLYLEKDALLFKTQKNMYETMLIKNEEIRRFRHDIQNHLMCLEELINLGNMEKVKSYVEGLENILQPNKCRMYRVGNDVIDIVINYYIASLDNSVSVTVEGQCLYKIKMSDVELCIVVSNLIQNATEALNQLNINNKKLQIEFVNYNEYFLMRIINTMVNKGEDVEKNKTLFVTTKSNKKEHGLGIKNAEETINKNGGILQFDTRKNEFIAVAMFPIEV